MIIDRLSGLTRRGTLLLVLAGMASLSFVSGGVVYAAHDEPSADHTYTYLELGKENTFRVYAQPGEWIHYTVFAGYRYGAVNNKKTCATINIQDSLGTGSPIDISGGNRSGTLYDGTTKFSDTKLTSMASSTCSADNKPFTEVTLSYQVPLTKSLYSMDQAYSLNFLPYKTDGRTIDGGDQRGYMWRITVNDSENDFTSNIHTGRVWVVGNDKGLNIWQDDNVTNIGAGGANPKTIASPAADKALDYNATNHTFKFVRNDGYRYTVTYFGYHGIWSVIHGGVYGVRAALSDGSLTPAYKSYANHQDTSQGLFSYTVSGNVSYIFVDCAPENKPIAECPAGLDEYVNGAFSKDASGNNIPIIRDKPITSETGTISDGTNTYSGGNPIADKNESGQKNANGDYYNLRYTGYNATSNLAGGTLTIPYYGMQTGTIRVNATWYEAATGTSTTLCQRDWLVDKGTTIADEITWTMKKDTKCTTDSYLYNNNAPTIPPGDTLTITVQALRLGEMHFVEVDTEERGGIQVISNNKDKSSLLAWYDPYSRADSDVCPNANAAIPPLVADGTTLKSGYTSSWDSMSSAEDIFGNKLPRIKADASYKVGSTTYGVTADPNRKMTKSLGGVHGWVSGSNCDANGSDPNKDGYSNYNGTATTYSTWGNDRVVDDWTYDDSTTKVLSLVIGGPSYALTPTVTVKPSAQVVPSQNPIFSYSVSNNTSSSNNTSWSIRSIIVPPGMSLPSDYRNGFDGVGRTCASYYAAAPRGAVTCNDALASGTGKFPGTSIADETVANTYAVGTLICRSLTVDSYNQMSSPNARTSALTCVMVTALPYVSVIGGSIWSGGSTDATTGYANSSGKIEGSSTMSAGFGSFGEYDLFATNSINFFGSSARPGPALASSGAVDGAGLTFGSATSLGSFSTSHKITDLVARLCNGVLGNNTANFAGNNDEVIHVGEHLVKCFDTLNIKKNITYDPAGATSFGQLPSLIVVANRIEIDGSVTQIAGNFYAAEAFVTCAEGPRSSADNTNSGKTARITTSGSCTNKLTINGSVTVAGQVVNSLVLNRSYGGTKTGEAAETIRMRPEVFLTPYENSLLLTTVSETELPARY